MAKHHALKWIDGRWHVQDRGIHAGDHMELLCEKGQWLPVRVESSGGGFKLAAFTQIHGRDFVSSIDPDFDVLRWPS